MAGTSTGNFPLPWLSEGTLGGAPQLCLLVYKPYQLFLVIHMVNHSEIGVMNQLNAILGAPLCNCFPWTLYMVFTSQVTPNYGNCWLWIPMTALLAMEHRVIHQFCRMSPNPTNKYGFPDFIRFHQIAEIWFRKRKSSDFGISQERSPRSPRWARTSVAPWSRGQENFQGLLCLGDSSEKMMWDFLGFPSYFRWAPPVLFVGL